MAASNLVSLVLEIPETAMWEFGTDNPTTVVWVANRRISINDTSGTGDDEHRYFTFMGEQEYYLHISRKAENRENDQEQDEQSEDMMAVARRRHGHCEKKASHQN
ncbi:hypothetical protein GH714_008723 [Hevea brasiliensis]|uniref:Uncharacterized protein n=1 Tax=Hevea brasiliensis TaxID=3981 RepID=A0A6A6KAH4_HEVBR|nr:hypothetical protein GH714_008723 [Hevea brasiliensis]